MFDASNPVTRMVVKIHDEWELALRLHIKPKPKWVPWFLYRMILSIVLYQVHEFKTKTQGGPNGTEGNDKT